MAIYQKYQSKRSRGAKAALHIDGFGYAEIAHPCRGRIITTRLSEGRHVRIDDGRLFPQVCVGLEAVGNTVSYQSPEQLARELGARLYRDRTAFERAAARILGGRK